MVAVDAPNPAEEARPEKCTAVLPRGEGSGGSGGGGSDGGGGGGGGGGSGGGASSSSSSPSAPAITVRGVEALGPGETVLQALRQRFRYPPALHPLGQVVTSGACLGGRVIVSASEWLGVVCDTGGRHSEGARVLSARTHMLTRTEHDA